METQHVIDVLLGLVLTIGGAVMSRLYGEVDRLRNELGEVKANTQTIERAEKYREEHRSDLREHRQETAAQLQRIFERLDYIAQRLPQRSDAHGQG